MQPVQPARAQELGPARMWLEPDCIAPYPSDVDIPEITIVVHGHNFTPGATIEIFSWERDFEIQLPEATVTADPYGTFDQQIVVRQPLFRGDYEVTAYDRAREGPTAETVFKVPCPGTVTVDPPCADPPAAGQQVDIRVQGTGWFDFEGFAVRFLNTAGQALDEVGTPVVNGSFDVTLHPPNPFLRAPPPLVAGEYAIIVVAVQAASSVTLFSVPCRRPSVDLQLPCGAAGAPPERYPLQIGGEGFQPMPAGRVPPVRIGPPPEGGYVEILFDVNGKRQEFVYAGGVPEGGGWGPVLIDPFLRPDGSYNVRVRQVISGYVLLETTTTFTVPCAPPRIELDPNCGAPAFDGEGERRYAITVRGFDFTPGTATITFDAIGAVGLAPELTGAVVAKDGTFTQPITPLARPAGTYQAHVVQDTRAGPVVLIAEFKVPCDRPPPVLTARCDPEEPELGVEAQVLIEGSGYFELAPVFVAIGGTELPMLLTDAAGAFSIRIPAAGLPPGSVDVSGTQRDKALMPVAQAATLIALPCGTPMEPLLRVVPEATSPGQVVLVEGLFFTPGEAVSLSWDVGIGAGTTVSVTPDSTGTFRLQVLIFHHDFLGTREMTAARPDDAAALLGQPVQLLVGAGRGSPPAFVIDGTQGPIVIRR